MKICQVLAGNEDGGLEKHTIELSKQLKKRGFDVSVIAHKDFTPHFKDINFIPLDLSKGRNNFFILYKLFKILKKEKFDIVHTQANKATDMVNKIRAFINDIKVVSTLHNYKSNLKAFEKSDYAITVSDKISENLKNPNKVTIYNGINFDNSLNLYLDLYKRYNIQRDKFIICSVARFTKVKRFELLVEAMKSLDIHLLLVGDGTESDNLKLLASRLNVDLKITFTGALDNIEVKKIISNSSLFVMSSDNEGFPYTFVETMFCKTPFISTPVSDMKKLLGEKYIIQFNNLNDIVDKVNYVQNNYKNVVDDFKEKFEFAEKNFTIDNMVNETIKVYKGLKSE
ncbi:glycosyltransferase family 4 protein [Arcobacter arenosus]|uniref:Glycosyltransferase family 4 protein n=1 Tax=Arcobacter arenosus TaxID=2576037 RepID=A0A5R8XZX7_9BACT|nr:glycosyltransferase family 4 protein [Arcobacter arenosus]TLP37799.1 glycosyltransferase family 4 protein [Arcobacter arenosus]